MKINLVTYSNDKYKKQQQKLASQAKLVFDGVYVYGEKWLRKTNFYKKNKNILDEPRGAGYWLWKPYIILETFKQIDEGDVVLYIDSSDTFKDKGFLGSFLLGAFFAMAFCPYSGALFFGMLMPLTIQAGLHLPLAYSMGTALPVVLFAIVIAYSIQKLGLYFKVITQIEKVMRFLAGVIFILTGLYYINMYFNII